MKIAFADKQVSVTKRKGVEEGSEIRVLWKCALANQKSRVTLVDENKISLTSIPTARVQTIQLSRNKGEIRLKSQVTKGKIVDKNQIVAAVVPVYTDLTCPPSQNETYFIDKLFSVNLSERYAAAKALRYRGYSAAKPVLEARVDDSVEDIYVQLEAAAALAAYNHSKGWEFIENKIRSSVLTVPLETQLETIIVASEIKAERSERLLIEVLRDNSRDNELRAGAAWALGQFVSSTSATALVDTFNISPFEIKAEAARALLRIAEPQVPLLINLLKTVDSSKRDGISWVLARTGRFNPMDIATGADDNLRRWLGYIVGYGKDHIIQDDIESICKADAQIYFAASVLWQILASWINDLKEY